MLAEIGREVSEATGAVTLLTKALEGVKKVIPIQEVESLNRELYELTRNAGLTTEQTKNIQKGIENLSKTVRLTKFELLEMQGALAETVTGLRVSQKEVARLAQVMDKEFAGTAVQSFKTLLGLFDQAPEYLKAWRQASKMTAVEVQKWSVAAFKTFGYEMGKVYVRTIEQTARLDLGTRKLGESFLSVENRARELRKILADKDWDIAQVVDKDIAALFAVEKGLYKVRSAFMSVEAAAAKHGQGALGIMGIGVAAYGAGRGALSIAESLALRQAGRGGLPPAMPATSGFGATYPNLARTTYEITSKGFWPILRSVGISAGYVAGTFLALRGVLISYQYAMQSAKKNFDELNKQVGTYVAEGKLTAEDRLTLGPFLKDVATAQSNLQRFGTKEEITFGLTSAPWFRKMIAPLIAANVQTGRGKFFTPEERTAWEKQYINMPQRERERLEKTALEALVKAEKELTVRVGMRQYGVSREAFEVIDRLLKVVLPRLELSMGFWEAIGQQRQVGGWTFAEREVPMRRKLEDITKAAPLAQLEAQVAALPFGSEEWLKAKTQLVEYRTKIQQVQKDLIDFQWDKYVIFPLEKASQKTEVWLQHAKLLGRPIEDIVSMENKLADLAGEEGLRYLERASNWKLYGDTQEQALENEIKAYGLFTQHDEQHLNAINDSYERQNQYLDLQKSGVDALTSAYQEMGAPMGVMMQLGMQNVSIAQEQLQLARDQAEEIRQQVGEYSPAYWDAMENVNSQWANTISLLHTVRRSYMDLFRELELGTPGMSYALSPAGGPAFGQVMGSAYYQGRGIPFMGQYDPLARSGGSWGSYEAINAWKFDQLNQMGMYQDPRLLGLEQGMFSRNKRRANELQGNVNVGGENVGTVILNFDPQQFGNVVNQAAYGNLARRPQWGTG